MTSANPTLPKDAVWLVTGTSSGIGFSLISSILSVPGHRIVVLSRNPTTIPLPSTSTEQNTLLQPIDLTSPTSIKAAFTATIEKFGRVDVVINNAGYGVSGELESISDEESRELFEINYWAPVQLTRLAMGVMRDVNPKSGPIGGVIAQISSIGGFVGFPGGSPYHGSKFALEGFTEATSKEPDPAWGIRFAIIEPGSVKTKWSNDNMVRNSPQHPAYVGKGLPSDGLKDIGKTIEPLIGADATAVADVIAAVLRGELGSWDGKELLRLPLGADAHALVRNETANQLAKFDQWKEVSASTSPENAMENLKKLGLM